MGMVTRIGVEVHEQRVGGGACRSRLLAWTSAWGLWPIPPNSPVGRVLLRGPYSIPGLRECQSVTFWKA